MRRAGFTLLEIIIVVGLMGLLMIALVPQLGAGFSQSLEQSRDAMAADLRYTSQRAIATGRLHRWTVDLDKQLFRIEEAVRNEEEEPPGIPTHAGLLDLAPPQPELEFAPIENRAGEWRWIGEQGVVISRVLLGDAEFDDGVVSIGFAGDGGADYAELFLLDPYEYEAGLRVLSFTGEVRIIEELE